MDTSLQFNVMTIERVESSWFGLKKKVTTVDPYSTEVLESFEAPFSSNRVITFAVKVDGPHHVTTRLCMQRMPDGLPVSLSTQELYQEEINKAKVRGGNPITGQTIYRWKP